MEKVTIKDFGTVRVPERNTKEEIITTVMAFKDDPDGVSLLKKLFVIEPEIKQGETIWCLNDECIEVSEPFHSEEELEKHMCECHLIEEKDSFDPFLGGEYKTDILDH